MSSVKNYRIRISSIVFRIRLKIDVLVELIESGDKMLKF